MTDRDPDNGQFTKFVTNEHFLREKEEHSFDHSRELNVARETAQRLEREVEKAAARIDSAVQTALMAVGETAKVHSEAHNKEHLAHERIHAVEKGQLDKSEQLDRQEAIRLASSLQEYKAQANEWRGSLSDQNSRFVARELFDAQEKRITTVEKRMAYYAGAAAAIGALIGVVIRAVQTAGP